MRETIRVLISALIAIVLVACAASPPVVHVVKLKVPPPVETCPDIGGDWPDSLPPHH